MVELLALVCHDARIAATAGGGTGTANGPGESHDSHRRARGFAEALNENLETHRKLREIPEIGAG